MFIFIHQYMVERVQYSAQSNTINLNNLKCNNYSTYKDINGIDLSIASYKHKFNAWNFTSSFSVLFLGKTLGSSR